MQGVGAWGIRTQAKPKTMVNGETPLYFSCFWMTQDPFQYSSKTCCKHANNCFEKKGSGCQICANIDISPITALSQEIIRKNAHNFKTVEEVLNKIYMWRRNLEKGHNSGTHCPGFYVCQLFIWIKWSKFHWDDLNTMQEVWDTNFLYMDM